MATAAQLRCSVSAKQYSSSSKNARVNNPGYPPVSFPFSNSRNHSLRLLPHPKPSGLEFSHGGGNGNSGIGRGYGGGGGGGGGGRRRSRSPRYRRSPSYGRRSYSPRGRSPKRRSLSPRGRSYSKSPPYRGREELPYANGNGTRDHRRSRS